MRKLLILAAVASLAACARQSEEVGRAEPETGATDTMTTRTGGYDTTRTAQRPDTITTQGDTAMVNRSVPDTSGRTGQTGYEPSGQAGGVTPDTGRTRADTGYTNFPDTSRTGQTGADTSRGPHPYDTTTGRTDTSFVQPTRPDTSMMRHDSM